MNKAIIIHGMTDREEYYDADMPDSLSNSHWAPWLQQKLCQNDILTQAPEMPVPYTPNYESWKTEFERLSPDENTLLVGHSCGGGFIVRWLSDNPDKVVGKVVLVAPWLDIEGDYPDMFDFDMRRDIAMQSKNGVDVLVSTNDGVHMQTTLAHLKQGVDGFNYHEFVNYGHFTLRNMKTREFPELLDICLGK
ncbi:MAG: alpha/beta fold hydrolase [Candidatus Saccharibacteria bacterium]